MGRLDGRGVSLWLLLGMGTFITSGAVYWWATDSNAPGLATVFVGLLPVYAILVAYGRAQF